jgi:hypothetical protein
VIEASSSLADLSPSASTAYPFQELQTWEMAVSWHNPCGQFVGAGWFSCIWRVGARIRRHPPFHSGLGWRRLGTPKPESPFIGPSTVQPASFCACESLPETEAGRGLEVAEDQPTRH